jgi:long-chain acyl-CoA synthetase
MIREMFFSGKEKVQTKKLVDGLNAVTYGDVTKRCGQLHAFFQLHNLRAGDRIGIASANEKEASPTIISCLRLGYPIAMIDAGSKTSEVKEILGRLNLSGVFLDEQLVVPWKAAIDLEQAIKFVWPVRSQKNKLVSRLLGKQEGITTYPECLSAFENSKENIPDCFEAGAPALFLCTSGTTGLPKILRLSFNNLAAAGKTTSEKLQLDSSSRILNLLPLTHYDGIVSGLFTTFCISGTMIRLAPFTVNLLPDIFDAIYKYRATHLLLTPSILALMLRLGEEVEEVFRSDDFQFVISVAASLPPKLWSDFQQKTGKKVVNVYGLSETGNNLFAGPDEDSYRIGSIGKPVDCHALIVNSDGNEVSINEEGELLLRGESITSGYLGETIASTNVRGMEWFATGDLAYQDHNGVFWLVGRKKNVIIVGGRNVYLDEINHALLSHPFVLEAATAGIPDDIWGERVVSFVVPSGHITADEILKFVSDRLTEYKLPREIYLLPEFPKGRSGKILVNELLAKLQSNFLQKEKIPTLKIEEEVLRLASESFRVSLQELSLSTAPQNCSKWDSVGHMDFVVNLESKFKFELLPREIIQIVDLQSAVRIVQQKLINLVP